MMPAYLEYYEGSWFEIAEDGFPEFNREIITFDSTTGTQKFNFYVRQEYTCNDGTIGITGRFTKDHGHITHWTYKLPDPIEWSPPDEA